jgi:hypothetical protein
MTDTQESIASVMRSRLQELSGEERLCMGFAMFDFAKMLVLSSLGKSSETDTKKMILLRFYGTDLDDRTIEKVMDHLTKAP